MVLTSKKLKSLMIRNKSQLELPFERPLELDRNHHLGGKSFYFFDFDDNVAYLSTPIVIFHKTTGEELLLSSGEYSREHRNIGKFGIYSDYFFDYKDETGSFRYFRDQKFKLLEKVTRKKQTFLTDIAEALNQKDYAWKAPSWECFFHATYNQRPMAVITARGHEKETIKEGIRLMIRDGHLPYDPNYLTIFPVTNPQIRKLELGDHNLTSSVAELKRSAIRESVEEAIKKYHYSPYHRFGMSDDDPHNVELITEEMKLLKQKYPEMSFFVIQTFRDSFIKNEVLATKTRNVVSRSESKLDQLSLF